jgi:alpha-beta hydrolase superfamily lysophospholipase
LTIFAGKTGAALDAIQQRLSVCQPAPVYLCGHSAGGASCPASGSNHPVVDATLPISGIFELEPLLNTYVNRRLQLTKQTNYPTESGATYSAAYQADDAVFTVPMSCRN